ncbi:hypothetical protein QUW35_00280 [Ligilactobacillus agilis]|uniref:hypothetical protein n=1 Tax=Ligilactobacillus agilis TaxID=1601 RepID=UPI0025A407BD|nr:hypothetical protein [Ligilactobacillus agilis]MDM8279132.1 hypothetical protein [Ligilactobacillus agilis]
MGVYDFVEKRVEDSIYSNYSKKDLVIEVEHLHSYLDRLYNLLEHKNVSLAEVKAIVMDALYESRV